MTQMLCRCLACARNGQQGGISIDARMHITADDVRPPAKRTVAKTLPPVAPVPAISRKELDRELRKLRKLFGDVMVEVIKAIKQELTRELAGLRQLEARLAAIEQRIEERRYRGIWSSDTKYFSENQCTADGARWHALRDSIGARPGDDPSAWQLIEKSNPPPPRRVTRSDVNGSGARSNSA